MSEKKLTLWTLIALLTVDFYYLYQSFTARKYTLVLIGPYEFPKILGIILAVLCVIALVQTLRIPKSESKKVSFNNLLLICATLAATALFIFLWQTIGHFYILAFLYLMFLLFSYQDGKRLTRRAVLTNTTITVTVLVLVYLCFELVMKIRL